MADKDPKTSEDARASKKLSTESYKGVRDFYPEDQFIQNFIFDVWRTTCESFGYEEYSASILEPVELYRGKTSEEIVNEQTYTFTDRGGRKVTLRPEMTPTVARMVAGKIRELAMPLRWYSIPNVFRYERPQRGRLREHWQLNVDAFGLEGVDIEVEVISLAYQIMKSFGLPDEAFEIRVSNKEALSELLEKEYGLSEDKKNEFYRLLDKKDKMDDFESKSEQILGKPFDASKLSTNKTEILIERLNELGVTNALFYPELVRGFEYYTGTVFEVFDTNPKNNRSLFGGGRYDELTDLFANESVPAFGFGMGDVTIKDTLETYDLLPEKKEIADLYLCSLKPEFIPYTQNLSLRLREKGLNVITDLSVDKVGNQVKRADKAGIPYVICIGEDEIKSDKYMIKKLSTGEEVKITEEKIPTFVEYVEDHKEDV